MSQSSQIDARRVQRYLRRKGWTDATIDWMRPLGADPDQGVKSHGYGEPLHVRFRSDARAHDIVLRTVSADGFGHDRRADRWDQLALACDTFDRIPKHIVPLDVGAFDEEGELHSLPSGEPFLVTNYVEGRLYAEDLERIRKTDCATELDLKRARMLAKYLVDLHSARAPAEHYARSIRDTIGHGEGIFGLCDSYDDEDDVLTPKRLERIEHHALRLRWRWHGAGRRCRRTHGDFHPFNLLFREGVDLTVLDCSRGAEGDPADDLTCLTINYLFFGLRDHDAFRGAFRTLWDEVWQTYIAATGDTELFEIAPLYFAWRGLVVVSPIWYPGVPRPVRQRLVGFIENLLSGVPFDPKRVEELIP